MQERPLTKDEVAQKMFEASYARLSAWGQSHVDEIMTRFGMSNAPRAATIEERNPLADNEKLAKDNENLRMEVYDLYEENGALKEEIEEMRHELEEIHSSRNSGNRQE